MEPYIEIYRPSQISPKSDEQDYTFVMQDVWCIDYLEAITAGTLETLKLLVAGWLEILNLTKAVGVSYSNSQKSVHLNARSGNTKNGVWVEMWDALIDLASGFSSMYGIEL